MAYLLMNYDMKMEAEGVLPSTLVLATSIIPNTKARIMFRKRQT